MPTKPQVHRPIAYRRPPPSQPAYDDRRGSAASRGYDRHWRKLRRLVLLREPLCRSCATKGIDRAAEHVDHIVPLDRGGTNADDNLQPLCQACHNAKTAAERGRPGRGRS